MAGKRTVGRKRKMRKGDSRKKFEHQEEERGGRERLIFRI